MPNLKRSRLTTKYLKRNPCENNDPFFDWIDEIDNIVLKNISMDLLDCPDEPYRDMFEDGETSQKVAVKIIKKMLLNM